MSVTDSRGLIRRWVEEHTTVLKNILGALGVRSQEDQADISQEVFCTAFRFLSNGHVIENPPAFLHECAKKQASNYRRKASRRTFIVLRKEDEPVEVERTPEQLVSASELVEMAYEHLDERSRSILFEVADGGSTWVDMARARGITVDQARYLHERAVARIAEIARPELKKRKRRAPTLLPALDRLFEPSSTPSAERAPRPPRSLWGGLEARFHRAGRRPRASALPFFSAFPRARSRVVGVLAGGLVIGSLLPGNLFEAPRPEPALVAARAEQASVEPLAAPPSARLTTLAAAPAPMASLAAAPTPPVRRSRPTRQGSSSATEMSEVELHDSLTLLDSARRELARGNLHAALALLARHEVRFPVGADTERRRTLTRLACAAAKGAHECSKGPRAPGSIAGL